MISSINIQGDVPLYVQIENHIKFAIASGKLKPGEQLPAMREVATAVGVNTNTVAKAYRDLEMLGLVYGRRGMGVFVSKGGVRAKCQDVCAAEIAQKLHEVAQESKAAGMKKTHIDRIVNASYATASGPYDEVPKEVMKLAK